MSKQSVPGHDVDRWLETGLRAALDPLLAEASAFSRPRYAASGRRASRLGGRQRLLAGGASAILLMGGSAMAAAAASTGTMNPVVWGQHITEAVASCRSDLSTGQAGIGQCVSAIANNKNHHGEHPAGGTSGSGSPTAPGHGSGHAQPGSSSPGSSSPGHGGTPPGHGGTPPGHSVTPPNGGATHPGHGGPTPGNSGSAGGHR